MDLKAFLEKRRQWVDARMEQLLPRKDYFPAKLHSAMRHSMFAGGKRLRPVLLIAAAEACGAAVPPILPAACALECIHTYSLIHDDLPAMDNDDWRRGVPTCHKVFGDAAAILAGDALQAFAFELLTRLSLPCPPAEAQRRMVQSIQVLAKASGMAGMVGGQMADINAEGQEVNLPNLQYIHTHKTGKLIQAAVVMGGILAGAKPAQLKALEVYGETMGLAFQIVDDVLNVIGDLKQMGKETGTDSARGKATYPALFGVEVSREQAERLVAKGVDALKIFGPKAKPLAALANFVIQREV